MLDSNIKTQKISHLAAIAAPATHRTSLSYLSNQLQILNTEIGQVIDIADDGDVIFTTLTGNEIKTSNPINAKIGDKIRIERKDDAQYNIISIVERNKENSHPKQVNDIIAVRGYKQSIERAAIIQDGSLHEGEVIFGAFINLDSDFEILDEKFISNISNSYSLGKNYKFKVVALGEGGMKSSKQGAIAEGLVSTLNEILSDDSENENSFAAKVVGFDQEGIVLKTIFGTLVIDKKFSLPTGVHLILKLVESELVSKADYEESKINNIIQNLESLQKILSRKQNSDASQPINNIIALIALALKKGIKKDKKDSRLEELAKILSVEALEEKGNNPLAELVKLLTETSEELKIIAEHNLNNIKGNWLVTSFPLQIEGEFYKPKLFINPLSTEIIRVISNISLSQLGDMQLDCLIKIKNKHEKEKIIEKIELLIRHKVIQDAQFITKIKEDFLASLKLFNIESNISFEQTDKFYTDIGLEKENQTLAIDIGQGQSLIV